MTIDKLVGKNLSISGDNSAVVSDLSGETFHDTSNNATEKNTSTDSITISDSRTNIGGRKRGSTLAAKAADATKREDVVTEYATLYNQEREKAKKKGTISPDGTLKKIVLEEEEKAGLTSNSISLNTIRSRVKRRNVTAYNPFEEPLIAEIEPILFDVCI